MRRPNTFWSFLLFSAVLLSSTRSQTDDEEQLQEAYEEARKKISELTHLLKFAEVIVKVLNYQLEAHKQQSSIEQNDLTAAELKIAQLTRQLAEASKRPQCNQNETNQLKDVSVQKLALLDEMRTKYSDLQNCPIKIGTKSNCKKIRGMGCYCIVEVEKSYSDAADYCARNNMTLVGIETREEWDLLGVFLEDNLGSREKYANSVSFWTSGVDEISDGRWQWTSSKQPLLFRKWGWYYHNKGGNRLLINGEKPFAWFNGRIRNEKGLLNEYFICESSALLQEVKHLAAYVNAEDCPHSIGTNSTCVYLDPDGCYCVVLTSSYWIGGNRHCKSEEMELVSIETEAEGSQIAAFLLEHQPSYSGSFWTSALYNEEKSQWVWTATGQSVDYANWDDGQPRFNEGEGHTIYIGSNKAKMAVSVTSLNKTYYVGHYICEKNTNSVDGPRNSQMKQKSCSAGSDWTCRNEVTGCYCHQTINRNLADASSACKSIGMNLVSIESAAEQLLVASGLPKLNDTTLWWTSGSDASGVWTWTATGRAMNYTNWAVDEPTKLDNSAHAVGMRFGNDITPYWLVYPLKKEYFPLCEK